MASQASKGKQCHAETYDLPQKNSGKRARQLIASAIKEQLEHKENDGRKVGYTSKIIEHRNSSTLEQLDGPPSKKARAPRENCLIIFNEVLISI